MNPDEIVQKIELLQQDMRSLKYVVAVSGGVDSVVLLHKIMANQMVSSSPIPNPQSPIFLVAHFDHGIREDSADDAKFVEKLANSYGLEFVSERAELGSGASEDEARKVRYKFLEKVMEDNQANYIVTAHHQDDVLETMVVNVLRGTGPRGLIGYTRKHILRPLIHLSKQDILEYAKKHKLEWREDSTNQDQEYLRNYVRINIMPKLYKRRGELLKIRENVASYYAEIDDQMMKLLVQTVDKGEIVRSRFVIYPYIVQRELMACYLRMHGAEINQDLVEKSVLAAKTLAPSKYIELSKNLKLCSKKNTIVLKVR